jgi:pimeloyl-ACP methyl ester carboxylesterase
LALEHPERLVGIHVTRPADPYVGPGTAPLTAAEQALTPARARWHELEGGYVHLQRTRPQSLAYGLADSPVGLAAWILEKWRAWSDCDGEVERRFTKDQLLTTVMLYWVTGTIGSSFRFHRDLRRFTDLPRGGHFTAMEEPELLAQDLRKFFRDLR